MRYLYAFVCVIILTGCFGQTPKVKVKYVQTMMPILKEYKLPGSIEISLLDRNGTICMNKNDYRKVVKHFGSYRKVSRKYKIEVSKYNQYARDINDEIIPE